MLQSFDARTGMPAGPAWDPHTPEQIDAAVKNAAAAAEDFASLSAHARAEFLRGLADALDEARLELVPLADRETGLGLPRLNGELDRTTYQLRAFAEHVESGAAHTFLDDAAVPGNPPLGRPALRRVRVPIGPVAVFAASNFPFAFSVLGGDTAAALAAGNPVVLKAHPAHPLLSQQVSEIAQRVVAAHGLPAGVFQFVEGDTIETGVRVVKAAAIAAVAFTGSFAGGTALAKIASERPVPIPFYGEMGSVNPLVVLPAALTAGVDQPAQVLAASICLGSGQFCTSPGIILAGRSAADDAFVQSLVSQLRVMQPHHMLSGAIHAGFNRGVGRWRNHPAVELLLDDESDATQSPPPAPKPFLAQTTATDFIASPELHEEVFGCAALVVRTDSQEELRRSLQAINGSLTVTLWGIPTGNEPPDAETLTLVRSATKIAGRVLFAGVPTGVAVSRAQHHGGPFPSSTAPSTTSVGHAAMERFLRPVAFQDAPAWLVKLGGVPL